MSSRPPSPDSGERPLTVSASRSRLVVLRLTIALLAPAAVTAALLTSPVQTPKVPELVYLAVIVLTSRLGRLWPAVLSVLVSLGSLLYFTIEPRGEFQAPTLDETLSLAIFGVIAFVLARALSSERASRDSAIRSQRRLAFIAEANDLLTRARLDLGATMDRLAGLVIPEIADWCTVDIAEDTGKLRTVAFAASAEINTALIESLRHQSQPDPNARAGIGAVMRTGRSELYSRVDDAILQAIARDARHLALLRGLKVRSMMKVPLFVRGRPAGAVTLASVQRRRRFTAEDLALAEDLASRAGTAIENARLYEDRVGAARTLQRSLLPSRIPEVPGLDIEARFQPFGEGDLVGGDFYDVFELRDGRWVVAVGDVCGKGVEAAVLTGLARHTIRASTFAESSPKGLLHGLNSAIIGQGLDRFCTVAIAVLEPDGDGFGVRLCNGGHPLPILLRGTGEAAPIGEVGTLLGLFDDVHLAEVGFRIEPSDVLVFYTDGWLDERLPNPEQALADAVKTVSGMTAKAAADRLARDAAVPTQDDQAMVIVRVPPG